MVLESLKCPECNGSVELDNNQEYGYCKYCGTKVQNTNFKVMKHKIELIEDDDKKINNLLERGYAFLDEKKWEKAEERFEKVLDLDSKNYEALKGILLSVNKSNSLSKLANDEFDYEKSMYYKKALKVANEEQKEELKLFIKKNKETLKKVDKERLVKIIAISVIMVLPFIVLLIILLSA